MFVKTEIFKKQLALLNSYVSTLECFRWLEVNLISHFRNLSRETAEFTTEMSISRIRIWVYIHFMKCAIHNRYGATRMGRDLQLFPLYCYVFTHVIQGSVLSQPVTTVSAIIALEFTANIYSRSLTFGLDGRAALSLLHKKVSYLNFR